MKSENAQMGTQKGQHIVDMNDDEARAYLETILWPDGPVCPHCRSVTATKLAGDAHRKGLYQCRDCQKQFTVTIGTIFEDSHLPLNKWVRAFHLMCSSKKGISALQLQRNLGLGSYRTAWHMAHRIRFAMASGLFSPPKLKGTVEADETWVGGVSTGKGGMWRDFKAPVVAIVERGGKKISLVKGGVTAVSLRDAIEAFVEKGAHINTDEAPAYKRELKGLDHSTVNHKQKEYVLKLKDGRIASTNTVESSFSLLKRGIVGAFHHVSPKHLHRYCAEFDYRWNERKASDVDRTKKALEKSKGKRLSIKRLKQVA
jgi:transposase-like protein